MRSLSFGVEKAVAVTAAMNGSEFFSTFGRLRGVFQRQR